MPEIINWSSANNSVLKINSLKYLLLFIFRNQILITSSKYKLNKAGDSGHPCLTSWVIDLESSDISLPALILINHTTTDHKEGEQLEDRRRVGASSCNSGNGTDQRIQSLMFTIIIIIIIIIIMYENLSAHSEFVSYLTNITDTYKIYTIHLRYFTVTGLCKMKLYQKHY